MSSAISEPRMASLVRGCVIRQVEASSCSLSKRSFWIKPSFLRRRSIVSSAPLLLANLTEALVSLVRNIALAHLIMPREFGLAISLAALIGIIEVLTDLGLPVYAVRKSIDLPESTVMATVHSLAIIRAAAIASILFALAPLLAHLFGAAREQNAYVLLGLIAFARGFENLGIKAIMRDFQFAREAIYVILSQLGGLGLTVVMAANLRSFTCVLWGLAASTLIGLVVSHVLSPTRYRLGWNRTVAKDVAAFSLPLLTNGLAVAFCLSDRLLIGGLVTPSALALYNVAVGTAQSPRCIAVKFFTSAFVPAFVRNHGARGAPVLFDRWAWFLSAVAFLYGFSLTLFGREALGFVFGEAYAPSRGFMALTALYISASFLMHLPVPPSYASGETKIISYGSGIYASAMLPALVVLFATRSLTSFVLTLALSVFIGLIVLLHITCRRQPFSRPGLWAAVCLPFGLLAVPAAISLFFPTIREGTWLLICGVVLILALAVYAAKLSKARATASFALDRAEALAGG